MDADSKRQKRRENILSLLGAAIVAMDAAKELPTPAKSVFGSARVLLTTIKVHLLFCGDGPQVHEYPGHHGQQNRLRRPGASLCRRMQSPPTGNERKENARSQSARARGDYTVDDVGQTSNTHFGRLSDRFS